MTARCGHCPRAGLPCRGEEVPRLCELVDPSHPDHAPAYVATLEPPPVDPDAEPPPPNPHLSLLKLVRECGHGGPWIGGCACTRRCEFYGRTVATNDCLRCVRDGGLDE